MRLVAQKKRSTIISQKHSQLQNGFLRVGYNPTQAMNMLPQSNVIEKAVIKL